MNRTKVHPAVMAATIVLLGMALVGVLASTGLLS